ncbi:MAG: Nif3-like dinuclear metal center hexameric protein [Sedimentisphaerales bacterium]|jgi:dinuclear metal center YbgI/SA1388 family protein|nr:Nif3-like dinuclear metal center hexameric protein [Sedimentisphaerales bacterium]
MKIKAITEKIEEMVPLKLAQGWDNVGFLVGDEKGDTKKILLTIDVTGEVVKEAKRLKADLILSYHPVIWDGLKTVTAAGPGSAVYELVRAGISVFSIHTALDSAIGGVNDGLAEMVGIVEAEPIGDYVDNPAGDNYKLVVFVPAKSAAKVSNAIFAAGAGTIGTYSNCGFSSEGVGSFLPLQGSKPAVGKKGKLEKVSEVRFETIVSAEKLEAVVSAMKKAHPYEMPAYDIIKLYGTESKYGLGRLGKLAQPASVKKIIEKIKRHTGAKVFGIIGDEKRLVKKAAVCAGSCGKIINSVIAAKCDLYVTGELKHHQALAAQQAHLTCICLSHTVSERFILRKLAKQLRKELKQVKIQISKKDSDPFNWKKL